MKVEQMIGGRYELLDQLGSGGMAVVWRARDAVLGRSVAVKLLAGSHATDPLSRQGIRDEARAAATLSHPNIAQVYDFGESHEGDEYIPYVVMELVPGQTLAEHMAEGPLSADFAFRVCAEVAAALSAAHADGLVHRDIKPANVMVTPAGAKVVDFGIAAAVRPGGTGAILDELVGTPAYLAPERLTGDAVVPASDVYALGVMLYRLLSGHSPWTVDSTTKMLAAHVYIDPMPLPQLPDVPDRITDLCNQCLSKEPSLRPSAREVATLLAQAAGFRVVQQDVASAQTAVNLDEQQSAVQLADSPSSEGTGLSSERVPPAPGRAPASSGRAPASSARVPASLDRDSSSERGKRWRLGSGRRRALVAAGAGVLLVGALVLSFTQDRRVKDAALVPPGPGVEWSPDPTTPPAGVAEIGSKPQESPTPEATVVPTATPTSSPAGGGGRYDDESPPADSESDPTDDPEPEETDDPVDPPVVSEPEPEPQVQTLTKRVGSVDVVCRSDDTAQLSNPRPRRLYRLVAVQTARLFAPAATFRLGRFLFRMQVSCDNGSASATVTSARG